MLEKTKLVIGKACMAERFRDELFTAGALPDGDNKSADVKAVEVLYVLERYEIYPSRDELQEILAVISPMPPEALDPIKARVKESPVGKAIAQAAKTDDVLDAVIAAIVGRQASLLLVLQLVHTLICPGLSRTDGKIERFSAPAVLRCPKWPNCPNN